MIETIEDTLQFCTCGHRLSAHRRATDKCLGTDMFGYVCECVSANLDPHGAPSEDE